MVLPTCHWCSRAIAKHQEYAIRDNRYFHVLCVPLWVKWLTELASKKPSEL